MQSKEETVKGVVIEAMPNTLFRILIGNEKETLAYLSGKMRMHKIRVLVGDTVEVLEDPYGGKARIVKRL
jgi:translation initiation factor IF-1